MNAFSPLNAPNSVFFDQAARLVLRIGSHTTMQGTMSELIDQIAGRSSSWKRRVRAKVWILGKLKAQEATA